MANNGMKKHLQIEQTDDSNFVYVNLLMANTTSTPTTYLSGSSIINATSTYVASSPFLENPSEYYGTIIRISIDAYSNPIFIPLVQTNQPDPNLTVYAIQLGLNGIYSDVVYVEYVNITGTIVTPGPVGNNQDVSTAYYFTYGYMQFLSMINTAMDVALNGGTLGGHTYMGLNQYTSMITDIAPYTFYDKSYGIGIKADKTYYNQGANLVPQADSIQIYVNDYLATLLNGLDFSYLQNSPAGSMGSSRVICNWMLNLYDQVTNEDSTGAYWIQYIQNQAEMCYWSAPAKYQVETTMPVAVELSQTPLGITNEPQQNQYTSVLTDFIPDNTSPVAYHVQQIYNQVNTLRMFDMTSTTPLSRIDASVFWIDNYGRKFNIVLIPGVNIDVKYGFIKKSSYRGFNPNFQ